MIARLGMWAQGQMSHEGCGKAARPSPTGLAFVNPTPSASSGQALAQRTRKDAPPACSEVDAHRSKAAIPLCQMLKLGMRLWLVPCIRLWLDGVSEYPSLHLSK